VKRFLFISLLLCTAQFSFAQNDTARLRISLLTCAPGDELYSVFGHTALRITDSTNGTDLVCNWGTFDFNDPDFYTKFVKGKLDYSLSVYEFPEFMYEYNVTQRDVIEQVLRLTPAETAAITEAIRHNLEGNNRYYKYDFLRDNCTSRVRDILIKYGGMAVKTPLVTPGTTFRHLIHEYLERQHMGWTRLGIDLLMGAPADKKLNITASMFLPDYLMKGVDSAGSLLSEKKTILTTGKPVSTGTMNWPLYILSAVAIGLLLLSFSRNKTAQSFTRFFDFLLLFLTGAIGCLLLFTWFGTDHASFKFNHNILWALPTNLLASVFVWNTARLKKYFMVAAVVYALLLIVWFWLPQQMNMALVPVVILLALRMARLGRNKSGVSKSVSPKEVPTAEPGLSD
jgi:hypothetical protein